MYHRMGPQALDVNEKRNEAAAYGSDGGFAGAFRESSAVNNSETRLSNLSESSSRLAALEISLQSLFWAESIVLLAPVKGNISAVTHQLEQTQCQIGRHPEMRDGQVLRFLSGVL